MRDIFERVINAISSPYFLPLLFLSLFFTFSNVRKKVRDIKDKEYSDEKPQKMLCSDIQDKDGTEVKPHKVFRCPHCGSDKEYADGVCWGCYYALNGMR